MLEGIYEEAKGALKTGTTQRGIGPVFADKVSYNGIRFFDLADEDQFSPASCVCSFPLKIQSFRHLNCQPLDFEQVYRDTLDQYNEIKELYS